MSERVLVISASGPVCSVALFESGQLRAAAEREAGHRASQALIELSQEVLAKSNLNLADIEVFVADRGPGSFIGVRVGVTLVKSWGFALNRRVGSLSSFDLVPPQSTIQSRKGFYFIREGDTTQILPGDVPCEAPNAHRAPLGAIRECSLEALAPDYVLEPSISTPKVPYAQA
ncbi:MAG: tRNA (adenosine(37)-N6)-threonylcarbamoyltransferase complex dimerization subunit type 1 TsaB [Fimbriimonadaceae bacterium]